MSNILISVKSLSLSLSFLDAFKMKEVNTLILFVIYIFGINSSVCGNSVVMNVISMPPVVVKA